MIKTPELRPRGSSCYIGGFINQEKAEAKLAFHELKICRLYDRIEIGLDLYIEFTQEKILLWKRSG